MKGDGRRTQRVADRVRANLAAAFLHLNDPLLSTLVITGVDVSPDLGLARVRVRLLVDDGREAPRRAALKALDRVAGKLRRGLGGDLQTKRVPDLAFHYDAGHDNERRVEQLLEEIRQEDAASAAEDSDADEPVSDPSW